MKRRLLALVFTCVAASASALATDTLDGEEIRKLFEGNTVSGRYSGGGFFTEYHHPDGRALGHNGYEPNRDACWTVVADAVCYYYGPVENRTTHCFSVIRNDRLYVLRVLGSNRINAVAGIEPGNPRNHDDAGKAWACDGLISRGPAGMGAMTPRLLARR